MQIFDKKGGKLKGGILLENVTKARAGTPAESGKQPNVIVVHTAAVQLNEKVDTVRIESARYVTEHVNARAAAGACPPPAEAKRTPRHPPRPPTVVQCDCVASWCQCHFIRCWGVSSSRTHRFSV